MIVENPENALKQLNSNPNIVYAVQDAVVYATATPNDPLYDSFQWNMLKINARQGWDVTTRK